MSRVAVMMCCVLTAATAAFAVERIPLTVTNRADVDRSGELAAGGVPLPRGAFKSMDNFLVVDRNDTPLPTQFTILNRWPADQSIRWI